MKLNKYTEKDILKYLDKVVKIVWLDIFGEQSRSKDEIDECPLDEQLISSDSYGKISKVNSGCLELLHEESNLDVTRTIMPISVISSIKCLR